ncbi:hypothetical protein [Zoogloea sp.]|uniref:hypothetical protein n=1 Tax=Zoogloea sp. TaxID=49181 RepID=UPI0035B2E7C7
MSVLRLLAPSGGEHEVVVSLDSENNEWSFRGLGFDFLASPIANGEDVDSSAFSGWQAEVSRQGSGDSIVSIWITCPPSGELTEDLFASACLKELGRFWDLFGELEGAE